MRRKVKTALGKAICVIVLASMLAGISLPAMTPVRIQPAQAQFGEVWLAIQVGFGVIKLTKDLFSVAKYFLGPDPTEEAMEELEQQMEQLNAMIEQEAEISDEIGAITAKLEYNNLTQEANNQIAAITVAYGQLQDIVENGYDYYQGNQAPLAEFARNVILPLNSMETAAEAFYQSLVVHPPGSPNCALQQARDIALDELNGLSSASDFSTMVESTNGVNVVTERPMYFAFNGALDGGSCQSGMKDPRTEHYFAEGTVRPGFHSFICVQNPAADDADVRITYMKGDATTAEQFLPVPAGSRATVNVNDFFGAADGLACDFSAKVESTNGVGLVVERPMYFNYNGAWPGGHVSAGAPSPATTLYLAEGTTRPGFDSYLCIQNPGVDQADVLITYMKGDGNNQQQELTVPAGTRTTVKVNDVIGQEDSEACDFSTLVESTNGVGLVVERPMYFSYGGSWNGGHCQGAVTEPSTRQYFAEGTTRPGFDSYLCLQNPGAEDAAVAITFMKGDGSNLRYELTVPAYSRRTVKANDALGQGSGDDCDFSALVESTNGAGLVAERAMYFNYMGRWNGGHCQGAVTEPSTRQYFAEGTRRPGFSTYLCIQNPEDREAEMRVTYQKGDGTSQVQQVKVPAGSRKTVNCSETVQGTSLLSAYQDNLEQLFKNSWLYQLMAAECVTFARDYDPSTYGSKDDYMTNYYNRYMKYETEMFLACTESLVMSQVDVSGLGRSQTGIFNLPADAKEVLTRADELAQVALGEGVPVMNPDGVVTDLNLGLNGRMIASRDIVPADTATPPAVRARVHGGSTIYNANQTELIPLPWHSVDHTLLSYDCWTGAAPYNTLTLDNTWSVIRYRFDNLPPGTYDILDKNNNVVSTGTVTRSSGTNPANPAETYSLTFGEFDTIANTRGGPAILLDSSRWTGSSTHSGALRESDDPGHYHSVINPANGQLGLMLYGTGGSHYTTYTYSQENRLERTLTAGADMDICPHYNFIPKQLVSDVDGTEDYAHGFIAGNITILPSHYKVTDSYELGITDLNTGVYTKIWGDSTTVHETDGLYDDWSNFSYDYKTGSGTYHMINGHQYKITFKLYGYHYLDTHDNSNMWAIMNQLLTMDGLRILGY